jgi:acetyltransferase-like isoleucine patch superfamily enzyme
MSSSLLVISLVLSAPSSCIVSFGDRTMVGANCSFYTPGHPISPEERNGGAGPEWGKEIIVGDDCWIGGSVVIVGPCHIGNGVTIGAGSVVTKDIPDRCVAVGNPARVVKKINADGSLERVARA